MNTEIDKVVLQSWIDRIWDACPLLDVLLPRLRLARVPIARNLATARGVPRRGHSTWRHLAMLLMLPGALALATSALGSIGTPVNVGQANSTTTGTTLVVNVPAAGVPAGNTILVSFAMDPTSGTVSVADSRGNIYTDDADIMNGTSGSGTGVRTVVLSATVSTALVSGDTITVTFPSVSSKAVSISTVNNLVSASRVDKTATSTGSSSSPSSGATATTTHANELLIGVIGGESKISSTTLTAGGSFSLLNNASADTGSSSSSVTVFPEYRIASATAAQTASGTLSSSARWATAIVTYVSADQIITFPSPGNQTYGVAPITLTATADSGLAVSYTVAAGPATVAGNSLTITGAGSVSIVASQAGNSTWNAAPNVTNTITVNPKALTVSGVMASGKVYDGTTAATLNLGSASLTGVLAGDVGNVSVNPTGYAANFASAGVGSKAVSVTGLGLTGNAAANYSLTQPTLGNATISAAPLTIDANDRAKNYGTTIATGTGQTSFTSTGLQNGETVGTVSLASTGAAATAGVGTYTITPSLATGGTFAAANYSITYTTGTLTVNPAPLSINASAQGKTYGSTLSLGTSAFTSSGLQNSQTIGSVTLTASGGTAATDPAGSYTITPAAATGGTFIATNYTVTYNAGTLTVNPKALTITANSQTKPYGTTLALGAGLTSFTSSGLQNSETIGSVTLTASSGTAATDPVGAYAITPSAATGGTFNIANYNPSYVNGTLTVTAGALDHYGVNVASSHPAGTAFVVTVAAQDSGNNTLTSNSGTVLTLTATGNAQFDHNGDGFFGDSTAVLTNGILGILTRDLTEETVTLTATDTNGIAGNATVTISAAAGAYRSIASGAWSNPAIWQTNNGSSWVSATAAPTSANAGVINIQSPNTVAVMANASAGHFIVQPGAQLTVSNGITLTIASGTGTGGDIFGTLQSAGTITTTGSLLFESGASYQHNFTTTAGTIPTATWDSNSTCSIIGYTGNTGTPGGLSQNFGNFTWNCPGQTGTIIMESGNITQTIKGDFTVVSTGTGTIDGVSGSDSLALTVNGDFNIQGGNFNFSPATGSGAGPFTLNLMGNYNQSGGTFTHSSTRADLSVNFAGASETYTQSAGTLTTTAMNLTVNSGTTLNLNNNLSIASGQTFTVNGSLDCGTGAVTGAGAFTLNSGATLELASINGLSSTAGTGNIQVTGGRTLSTGANYLYDGGAAQSAGNALPSTINNLTIKNAAGVTLAASTTVNGTLFLNNGVLTTGGFTLSQPAAGTYAGASSTSHVNGNYLKNFNTGNSQSFTFPIGDSANYEPLSLASMNVTHSGTITAKTVASAHPNLGSSLIDSAQNVNRYWTITNGSLLAATYAATFNYSSSDVDAGATPSAFIAQMYNGSSWANATLSGTPSVTTAAITGQSSFGDFSFGMAKGNQTITFPAIGNQTYGVAPITLGATASSGLPVNYAVTGPATVNSGVLTITGAASVTVTASQPGNGSWNAATSVPKTISVAKLAVTGSVTINDKTYDGATNATIATRALSGVVGSDNVALSGGTAGFTSKHVGTGKTVNVTGLSLVNSSATNYTLASTSVSSTASITARALTVTGASTTKGYDGTNTSATTPTISSGAVQTGDTAAFSQTYIDRNVGTGKAIIPAGAVNDGNSGANYSVTFANANVGTITARAITVKAVTDTKVYDATNASSVIPTITSGSLAPGDSLAYAEVFNNKNVGTGKTLTPVGSVNDNNNGANYAVTANTVSTGVITARPITVTAAAVSKVFDGNTSSPVLPGITSGTLAGADAANFIQTFNDRNVGTSKTVTPSGSVTDGNNGANYSVTLAPANVGAITASTLIGSVTISDKVYDGTLSATIATHSLSGVISPDVVNLSGGIAQFDDKNVGSGKNVVTTGLALGGANSGNYLLASTSATNTASITPRALAVTATGVSKVYDGNLNASVTLTDNRVAGDDLNETYGTASFVDKNAGPGKQISVTGIMVAGGDAGNYNPNLTTTATAAITPADVTGSVTANDKIYDGTSAATIATRDLAGVISPDSASLIGGSAQFSDKNVDTNKTVNVTALALTGPDAGNYALTSSNATTTASITPASVTLNIVAADKIYDGSTAATISETTTNGWFSPDDLTITGDPANFASKNAGSGLQVTMTNLVLSGNDSTNYQLSATSTPTTASITPLPLTVTGISAAPKIYDGATNASVNAAGASLNGAIAGDDVSLDASSVSGSFIDKNAGPVKSVNINGLALLGNDSANYSLAPLLVVSYISPALVTANITAADKEYDGGVTAAITGRTLTGVLGLDSVSLTGGTATFNDKNVQTGKTVTASGLLLEGADAGNYGLVSSSASTTASITSRALNITATGIDKIYDNTSTATATYADDRLANDVLTVAGSAAFADASVGTNKPITISNIGISGSDAGNYTLAATTASATASISPALLTVKANDISRPFSTPNPTLSATYTGFVTGDDTNVLQGLPAITTAADTNSPEGIYPITITNGSLTAANYSFKFVNGSLTIVPAGLLFSDDFTRDTDPQALTAPWSMESGNWTVTGGQLTAGTNNPMTYGYAFVDTNWTDYEAQASLQFSALGAFGGGIGGRLNAATGSHYAAWVYPDSSTVPGGGNSLRLIKFQDWQDWGYLGTNLNPMAEVGLPGVGTDWHTVKLAFRGNLIAVYFDGVKVIETNDLEAQPLLQGGITADLWTDASAYTLSLDNVQVASPQPQAVTFTALADKTYGDASFDLTATASSGLPVSFSIVSGPASIAGSTLTITGAGPVTVRATQAGDAIFNSAADVEQSFIVNPAPLVVVGSDATRAYGAADPAYSGSISGIVNSDNITATFGTTATSTSGVGTYDITPVLSDPNQRLTNYSQSVTNGVLTITPGTLTVAVADATKIYGAANPGLTGIVTGLIAGDGMTIGYTCAANITSPVGHYDVLPTFDDPNQSVTNYTVNITSGTLNITPAPLIVTANNQDKTYGQSVNFAGTEFTTSGLVNSDSVASVSLASDGATATAAVTGSPYSIIPSAAVGSGLGNYAITYGNGSLSVAPAPLSGIVQNVSHTYGALNPPFSVAYSGFVNNEDSNIVTGPIAFSCMRDSMPADTNCSVGICTIHVTLGQTAPNYTITYTDGSMTVEPAALLVSAQSLSKAYGATNPVPSPAYLGFMNSEDSSVLSGIPAFDVQADTNSPVGQYPIVVSQGTLSNANYSFSFSNASLSVTAGAITITANDSSKTYGQSVSFAGTEFTVSGLQGADSVTSVALTSDGAAATAAVTGSPYSIIPSAAVGSGLTNYTITYANGSLTVNPAALTITANDTSKTYGQSITFAGTEFTVAGLTNSDSVASVSLASDGAAATAAVIGSPYSIIPSAAVGSGLTNYTVSYANGSLTVNPAALIITANDTSKTYGQSVSFAGTEFTVIGLTNSDSVASVTLASDGATATAAVTGSPYSIIPSAATGSGLGNYAITYANGSLSVAPASLAGAVQNATRPYGAANPGFSVVYSGFVNNEDSSIVTGPVAYSCSDSNSVAVDTNAPVGSYPVHVSLGQIAPNYTITYTDGSMTVEPATLLVSAQALSKAYGATNPVPSPAYLGFMNSEDSSVLSGIPAFDVQADTNSPVGQYPIVVSQGTLSNANYSFSFSNASLSVTAGAITITANDSSKTYGQSVSFAGTEFTVSGLQGADSVTSVALTSDGAAATAAVTGSPYSIIPSAAVGSGLTNYTISYANGSLTVNPAALTITANNNNKTYGQSVTFAGTEFTVTGLTNSDSVDSVSLASDGAAAIAAVNGSPYSIIPSAAVGSGLTNYTVSYANGGLSIAPASLTLTATDTTKVYGQPNPTFSGAIEGVLNSDGITLGFTTTAGDLSPVGVYPITPVATDIGRKLANYSVTTTPGQLSITPASSSITWTNPAAIVYGLALGANQLNATASGPGALVYDPPAGTVLNVSNAQVLSVNFAPADTNYLAASATVVIDVLPAATVVAVNSSTNPALPGSVLTLTATLTPVIPGSATPNLLASGCSMPTGAVQFSVDGSPVGIPVPTSGCVASFETSALAHGAHTISAAYLGDTNFMGTTNVMTAAQIVNTPPTAAPCTVSVSENNSLTFSASRLLQLASDADGDAISLSNVVSTNINGGTVSLADGMVTFNPAPDSTNTQTFAYTIVDSLGGSATAQVTVNITPTPAGSPSTPSVSVLPNGHASVGLAAAPGENYILQGSSDLKTWVNLGHVVGGPDGMIHVEDGDAPDYSSRFYRLIPAN